MVVQPLRYFEALRVDKRMSGLIMLIPRNIKPVLPHRHSIDPTTASGYTPRGRDQLDLKCRLPSSN